MKKNPPKTSAAKKAAPKAAKAASKKPAGTRPRAAKAAVPKANVSPKVSAKASKASASKPATSKAGAPRRPKSGPAIIATPEAIGSATLDLILARLDDMKAENTVTIDLRGKSAISDYMVVTTGRSNRHVGAVAENVAKGLKEKGIKGIHVEGMVNADWVLIDSGEVIVHIFRPEVREFYNLERLWMQTPDSQAAIAKPA